MLAQPHPRRQAMLAAAIIWGVDLPVMLAPAAVAGQLDPGAVAQALILVSAGWLLCLGVFEVLDRMRDVATFKRLVAATAVALAAGLLLGLVDLAGLLVLTLSGLAPETPASVLGLRFLSNTIFVAWMFVLFSAVVLLLDSNRRVSAREAALARAQAQAAQAQSAASTARLAALRYQLNPHFLFNTLNAVSSAVVSGRNDQAEAMLSRLADFLRVTLTGDPGAEVRLEDELGTVEAYLEIESERFRSRMTVEINCPSALRDARTPSFVLQPLIENAIKHGVSRSRARVRLAVDVTEQDDDLVISVTDDAQPLQTSPAPPGGGIGLTAVRERLEVLYGARGVLMTEPLDRGFRVTLRFPLSRASQPKETV